ncbi:MAG: hypothetical protein M0T72_10860 [Candidatus Dormibacteraeota bacterium]|nr:hypothetical protein [Candidatus Dormibacteraeota bacterium]
MAAHPAWLVAAISPAYYALLRIGLPVVAIGLLGLLTMALIRAFRPSGQGPEPARQLLPAVAASPR